MALTGTSTRTVSPNDIVVPLSDIIQRLSSKLSQADIDSLVAAILARRTDVVRPGDLITADLMNQMLADIADLQTRVLNLEANTGTSTRQVVISSPLPGEQFKVGQDMTVLGQNFGFSTGAAVVHLDDVLVTSFKAGSSDQQLLFTVPELSPPVLPGGRSVLLSVSNGESAAQRLVKLLSARDLEGSIDVVFQGVDPATVPVGSTPLFKFNLHSRANYDASFTIQPSISGVTDPTTWNGALSVLDANTKQSLPGGAVTVPEGGDVQVLVQLRLPSVANATPFTLSVGAVSGPVTGTTGPMRVVVGTGPALPDPNTTLGYDSAQFDPVDSSNKVIVATDENTVQLKAGALAQVTLVAVFKAVGTYVPSITAVNEGTTSTTNWSLKRHPQDPPNYPIAAADLANPAGTASRSLRFLISPSADTSNPASATGEVEFALQATGATTLRTYRMKLAKA